MGCGMFLGLAQTTVLATGPALKQEERKSPFKAERPERAGTNAQHHAFWGCGIGPEPGHTLLRAGRLHSSTWGYPPRTLAWVLWIL